MRLDIRRVGALKKDEDVIGNRTRVKVVKNKMAPPFKEVEFDILYGHGISREGDLVDLASDANIIDKSGAWFSYAGERIGQGRENAKQFLIDHPDMYNSIEAKVLAHHNVRRIGIDVPLPVELAAPIETDEKADHSARTDKPDRTDKPVDKLADKSGKATAAGSGPVRQAPVAPPPSNGKRPNA